MRSFALFCELLVLLPVTFVQPFVGVILWSWISFMNPHQLVFGGIGYNLPWALIIFCVTMVGCMVAREPKRFPMNGVTVFIALFMVMITFTTVFAQGPMDQVLSKYYFVFKVFLFLLVTAALLTSKERIHALIWVMVLSLAYFGIKGGGFTVINGGSNRVFGPPATMINDNNHLAVGLLVALPLMNYLRLQSKHFAIRLGLAATMVLTVFAVVGSYSRGALLALTAVSLFLWWKSQGKIISGFVLVVMVGSAIFFMPQTWVDRMNSIGTYQEDASAEGRLAMWHTSWVIAISRPLTGAGFVGPYQHDIVDQFVPGAPNFAVHSIWFETLGEHGFPTFFVWLGITVAGAMSARRIIKRAAGIPELAWCVDLAKMSQVSIIAYLVGGSFLSLEYWDYYFTMLVGVAATHEHVKAVLGQEVSRRSPNAAIIPSRLALSR